jgi:proteasome accessory factor B
MANDRTERLLNLVLCLTSTQRAVPRESLREVIPGYSESASDTSFQRMFERDKDDLRSLGIPVETVSTAEGEVIGYLIPQDSFWLPKLNLTPQQIAILGLAAQAWSQAAIGTRATHAVRRLEAASVGPREHDHDGDAASNIVWAAQPTAAERALPALWEAIRTRTAVSFDYRGLRDVTAHTRNVHPWGVIGKAGGWYLVGWDIDRNDSRVFRTSRMTSIPVLQGQPSAYQIPSADIMRMVEIDAEVTPTIRAIVALAPGAGARIRRAGQHLSKTEESIPPGWDLLQVNNVDEADLVAQVAAIASQARIIEPSDLHKQVVDHLETVRNTHTDHGGHRVPNR